VRHRFVTRRLQLRLWAGIAIGLTTLYALQQLPLGQKINLFVSPLVSTLQMPVHWWQDISLWLIEKNQLQSENMSLQEALQQQAGTRQELRSLRIENAQLRGLLELKSLPGFHWRAAKVLGRSPDKMSQRLLLRTQGKIGRGDVAASSEGLVGLVDAVHGQDAVVRTILDASLAVPVTLSGSGLAALVRGQGETLRVEFIPFEHAPPETSILITSGAGGVFPPGIPVARITRIHPIPGSLFAEVNAEPVAHWRRDAWLSVASRKTPSSLPFPFLLSCFPSRALD